MFNVTNYVAIIGIIVGHAQRTPTISIISQEQIKNIGGTVSNQQI